MRQYLVSLVNVLVMAEDMFVLVCAAGERKGRGQRETVFLLFLFFDAGSFSQDTVYCPRNMERPADQHNHQT